VSSRSRDVSRLSQSVSHVNTNAKLVCAAGLGAAVQLGMAYELAAVATRDAKASRSATRAGRVPIGGPRGTRILARHQ
jgi:hypothetical protein